MAIKKIKLPDNTTEDINDSRLPAVTTTDNGKVLSVSGGIWSANSKPSYTLDEVSDGSTRSLANYLPLSGGTLSSASQRILTINHTSDANNAYFSIRFADVEKAALGYDNSAGLWMKNMVSASGAYINIDDSGIFKYKNLYTIYHSGNFVAGTDYQTPIAANTYAPYNSYGYLPLNGGTISSAAIYPLTLNSTNTNNAAGIRFSVSNTNCGGIYVTSNHDLRFYDESSVYTIYHSGNFIAGTNYQAPIPANTYAPYNSSGYLPLSAGQSSPLTDALYINAASVYNLYVNNKSSGATVSGIRFQTGGTTNGALLIDSNHTLSFHDNTDYRSIYHSGNFIAGTDYVGPSALNNYLPKSGGNVSGFLQIFSPNTTPFGVYGGSSGAFLAFGKTTTTGSAGTRYGFISINAQDGDLKRYTGSYGGGYKIYDEGNYSGGGGSDARLKENVETISSDDAKDTLSRLRPVRFDWNEKAKELDPRKKERVHDVGFIAQEAKEIVPSSVTQDYWDEYYRMDNAKLVAFLVKGWQEHEKEIAELKEEIKKLKDI